MDTQICFCLDLNYKVMYEQEKKEKSLRHHLLPMIFDHLHSIPKATHLLQLCCQDMMCRDSILFNYSRLGSIYMPTAKSLFTNKNPFVSEILRGKMFLFFVSSFPSYIKSFVFPQPSQATTSHLVCCCIKLWHHPFLIVSRPGKGWVFILFSVS